MKPRLLYALHSGQLYGTERMSLATAAALADDYEPVIFAPDGPALEEAQRLGMQPVAFNGAADFFKRARPFFAGQHGVACVATALPHSIAFCAWSTLYRVPATHLHVVHGGTDEKDSYGRKRLLQRLPVRFVAVSAFVRERLIAHGVNGSRITVIENFLPAAQIAGAPVRGRFIEPGLRQVTIVSRVDPIKRVDLLLDALDRRSELRSIAFDVLGAGWDLDSLRTRGLKHPNVTFHGFVADVADRLAKADLLLHLCPCEPFGLAVIESMAAGVPVLVPDAGGAGSLVVPGRSGYLFPANNPDGLARTLLEIARTPAAQLNAVVAGGRQALTTRFSAVARANDYRALLRGARHSREAA